jgi:UDP-N-acetylmuramoylalanine--D-glutamate ligase
VVGVDDQITQGVADRAEQAGIPTVRISARYPVAEGVYARGAQLIRVRNGSSVVLATLTGIGSLRGQHNAQNAAAASAAALALGVPPEAIASALPGFPGLKHRMEQVGRRDRVLFVNDSKATNADAASRALSSYETIFWIAGGRPKAGGITGLGAFFPRIRKAYLVGEAAEEFSATLSDRVPHVIAGTLDRAVELAAADAALSDAPEPVVLLSPACASYDQFPNFEVRGDAFREIVGRLP